MSAAFELSLVTSPISRSFGIMLSNASDGIRITSVASLTAASWRSTWVESM
jgi:hypothetical protein